jgi:hypothetical protein
MNKLSCIVLLICQQSLIMLPLLLENGASAEPLTFRSAIELAAKHGVTRTIAASEQERAHQAYKEAESLYLPQMFICSAIGYSAGFPLSLEGAAPSIFNVASQQFLFNPAQRSFVKSTRALLQASTLAQSDQTRQSALDAAAAYFTKIAGML